METLAHLVSDIMIISYFNISIFADQTFMVSWFAASVVHTLISSFGTQSILPWTPIVRELMDEKSFSCVQTVEGSSVLHVGGDHD